MTSEKATDIFFEAILRSDVSQIMIGKMANEHRLRSYHLDSSMAGEESHRRLEAIVHAAVSTGFEELKRAKPEVAAKADQKKVEERIVRVVLERA